MAVKEFDVEVVITHQIKVRVDTDKFGPDQMAEFRQHFYDFDTLERHAKHIAQYVTRCGDDDFIEGYGYVKYEGLGQGNPFKSGNTRYTDEEMSGIYITPDYDADVDVVVTAKE